VCHIFVNKCLCVCVCVCVCEVYDEVRRERNLEMLVIRNEPSIARNWLFLTGILFCVPLEHEKGSHFWNV